MQYNLVKLDKKKNSVNLDDLLSYKFDDGTSFPLSYVEFARQYGFGITCGEFLIYIPMGDYCDNFFYQSRAIKATYSDVLGSATDVWFPLEPDMDFETLKRLIPFAKSENGYYLFWDTKRSTPDEMDIYITDFRGLGFVKAAANLYELIDKITNPNRFKEVFPLFVQKAFPSTFKSIQKVL